MKKYGRSNIGLTLITNEGYKLEVVDGGSEKNYVTVMIRDWICEVIMSQVRTRRVKYPFHKSIFGVGYFGAQSTKGLLVSNGAYKRWVHMIERCYDEKCQIKQPEYIGCTVSEEWHNFQNFAKWHNMYYPKDGKKYQIDKDIKVKGNKIYSKETCIFVQAKLNAFMATSMSNSKSGVTGVTWNKPSEKWIVNIKVNGKNKNLGRFNCIKTAEKVYKKAREIEAKKLKDHYSFDCPKHILDNIR